MTGVKGMSWHSMSLTTLGWAAVSPPQGVCPGDDQRPCLARTPEGRRCYFCARTVELAALQAQYAAEMDAWGRAASRIAERRRNAG